jgi:phosphate transport system protein
MNLPARSVLDQELAAVRRRILQLGELVADRIEQAVTVLRSGDRRGAEAIVAADEQLNQLRFEIEERCFELTATQQPAAGDLRQIIAAMNIVVDLERMADHAAGVAKTVLRMGDQPRGELPSSLEAMANLALGMLREVLEVYAGDDVQRAYRVASRDNQIDEGYQALFRELVGKMADDPSHAAHDLYLLFAGHNLERIADRVTNIAERVIFTASGEMHELNPEPDETRIS